MNSNTALKTYTGAERRMYLVGMAGQNVIYSIIGATLAYYLQFTILVPAIAVGVIMTIARVWDAFLDPIMGTIVDKTRSKWGKCRPFLLFVPVPILILTVLCYTNFGFFDSSIGMFQGKNALIIIWVAASYIIWGTIYSAGDVPLWGITALMTEDQKDRAKLLSFARIAGGIGAGITVIAIQPIALQLGKNFTHFFKATEKVSSAAAGERMGFIAAVIIFGVLGTIAFQMAGLFARERIPASKESHSLKENFKLMWTNKPFRQILLSGILGSPKQLLTLAAMPLITYYYASKDPKLAISYMALMGGGIFLGQFVTMGFVPKLLKRVSKKNAYNYSNLLSTIPFIGVFALYLIGRNNLTQPIYLALSILMFAFGGAAGGITTVLQSLLIADAVDYEEYHNGIRPDGVFFAGQTFIAKLTTGIATILSAIAYAAVGFSGEKVKQLNDFIAAGGIPRDNPKYDVYIMLLFFLISIPPAVGCVLSVIPTWHYSLDDDEHTRILGELNKRRHENDAENPDETATF